MKTTTKHFEVFKTEVLSWVKKFGLTEWEISFLHKILDHERAALSFNICGRTATFMLTSQWTDTVEPLNNAAIKAIAKHEAIELLLGGVHGIAISRYATEDEFLAAHHALVRRLEKLL